MRARIISVSSGSLGGASGDTGGASGAPGAGVWASTEAGAAARMAAVSIEARRSGRNRATSRLWWRRDPRSRPDRDETRLLGPRGKEAERPLVLGAGALLVMGGRVQLAQEVVHL